MNDMLKRILSFTLALVMVFGMIPANVLTVSAAETETTTRTETPPADVDYGVWVLKEGTTLSPNPNTDCGHRDEHTHGDGCNYLGCAHYINQGHTVACYGGTWAYCPTNDGGACNHTSAVAVTASNYKSLDTGIITAITNKYGYKVWNAYNKTFCYVAGSTPECGHGDSCTDSCCSREVHTHTTGETGCYVYTWTLAADANNNNIVDGTDSDPFYTVTYNVNGEEQSHQVLADSNGNLMSIPGYDGTPSRTGYTFTGWEPAVPATLTAGNHTFTAQWKAIPYTITWNAGEGTFADGEKTTTTQVDYDATPVAPATPSKSATVEETFSFAGWTPAIAAVSGEAEYVATYTASARKYDISWDIDGDGDVDTTTQADYGSVPVAPEAVAPENKSFEDWSPAVTNVTGEQTYTATFSNDTVYTVTFKVDGELYAVQNVNVTKGKTVVAPDKNPDKAYAIFDGWTNAEVIGTVPTGPVVLEAKWVNDVFNNNVLDEDEMVTINTNVIGNGTIKIEGGAELNGKYVFDSTATTMPNGNKLTVKLTVTDTDGSDGAASYLSEVQGATATADPYVYTLEVTAGGVYNITATFAERALNANDATAYVNLHSSKLSALTDVATVKAMVLTAALGTDNYNVDEYIVYKNVSGDYINLETESIADKGKLALAFANDLRDKDFSDNYMITWLVEPEVTKTVFITVADSRPSHSVSHNGATYTVDALDDAFLAAVKGDLTADSDVTVTLADGAALPAEGQTGNVVVNLAIAEDVNFVAYNETLTVSVTNNAHYTKLNVLVDDAHYTVEIKDAEGNVVNTANPVASGSYFVSVTPDAANGYFVDTNQFCIGGEYNPAAYGEVEKFENFTYIVEIVITNNETVDTVVDIEIPTAQRKMAVKPAPYSVTLLDDMTEEDLKAAIYGAIVDPSNSNTAPDATGAYTVTGFQVAEGDFEVTITYPGKADEYPEVSGTFTVTVSKNKVSLELPAVKPEDPIAGLDEIIPAVENAIRAYHAPQLNNAEIKVELPADAEAPKQGETKTHTVKVTIAETETTRAVEGTAEVTVTGKVEDAKVTVVADAEHGQVVIGEIATASVASTYPAGKYAVTLIPNENYFIDSLIVAKDNEEPKVYTLADFVNGSVEIEIENGKGRALGDYPEYVLTATFVEPAITIVDGSVVTYYGQDATELPEDILVDVKPVYTPEELIEGAKIDTDPTVTTQEVGDLTVYYLARKAATFAETITLNLPVIGNQTFTVDIPAGDQWLEISQEIPTGAGKPTQEEIQAKINELLEKYSWTDLLSMGTDGLKELAKTEMSDMYEQYYRFYNAHSFGMAEGATETIKIVYNSDIYGVVESNVAEITLKDDRAETEIRLNEGVEMTYGFTAEELYAKLVDGVYANGAKIEGAKVEFVTKVEGMNASDEAYTVQVSYAGTQGTDGYKHATAEATIKVNKAPVDVFVDNRLIKYGTAYEMPVGTNPAGVDTIKFIVGLDISDINVDGGQIKGIMGDVQLMIPAELQSILESVGLKNGMSMTISELQNYLDTIGKAFDGSQYEAAVDILLNMLNSLPTETADIKITVGGQLPSNIGVYLIGAVSADGNYETNFGVGVVAITPDGNKAEIDWVMDDENGIITRTLLTEGIYDMSAEAISLAEGGDLADATAQIVEVFLGVDVNGKIVLTTDQTALNVGAYTELAMIVNWGNTMYYSEPIARAFVVIAESLDVDFVDHTGEVNNERHFVFNNVAHSEMEKLLVTYKQDGNGYTSGQEVADYVVTYYYVGTQTNGIPYASKSAPVHAGAYTVTAVVVKRTAGEISHVGVGVGAMVIEPTTSNITVETKAVPYIAGTSYGTGDMVKATSAVAGLTPDSTVITAGITTDRTFTANGLDAIVGTVNVDMPSWMDKIFTKYGILEAGYTDAGITVENLLGYVQKIQDILTDLGLDTAAFDSIIDVVEQMSANTRLTFFDNASYSTVGAYLVIGVVTDSDHYPSVAAGVLVIYPNVTEVELKFEEDWNGNNVFTWKALQSINLDAQAYDLGTNNVNKAATEKVTNIYLGFNDDGMIVLTTDKSTLDNGAYTQLAVLLDLGSEMYYADPITRAFLIVPNPATIEFVDENGNVNNERLFTFDNKQHGMDIRVTVDGKVVENPDLIVTYVGAQSNLEVYKSSEAPVHTGVYAVTALYTARDAQDRVVTLGAAAGTLVIEPAKSTTEVSNKIHTYDGAAINVADMVKVSSAVKGIAPNATIISAAVNTDGTFSENLAGAITGSINVDLPAWVDAYIAKSTKLADGVTVAGALAEIKKLEAELAEIGEELEVLSALTTVLEQLPTGAALTFNSNMTYNAVGAYLVVGVVTDSNHYPSMDAGFLVIHPTVELGELEWKNVDSNNIFYLDSLTAGYLDAKYVGNETLNPTELYLGVDADSWEIYLSKAQPDAAGVYTELAYLIDLNSNAHFALPIIRPVVVVDGIYDVLFHDENGNVNHNRLFTYNGEEQPIGDIYIYGYGKGFYADAIPAEDTLQIHYIGSDITGDGWLRSTPPTDVGAYTVIAIYTDYDENGVVIGGGAGAGAMVIKKADLALDMVDTTVTYDGNEHSIDVTSNDQTADYLTVIVDKEANVINFILEDDLSIAGGVMKVLLEKALGRELDGSFTVTEVQQAMHKIIDAIQNYQLPEEIAAAAAKLPADLQSALHELKDSTYDVVKAELDAALESLQSVIPHSGTVVFNGKLPVDVGTYQFYGFAVSENYEPEATKGVLTIEMATNAWTIEPSIEGWNYGEEPNAPAAKAMFGEVKIEYRPASGTDADFTTTVPAEVGDYVVRFTVEGTKNYTGLFAEVELTITTDASKDGLYPITMGESFEKGDVIYVDGVGYELDDERTAYVPMDDAIFVTTYTYNVESSDPHEEYPIHMYVWQLTFCGEEDEKWTQGEYYTAKRIVEFDDIMQYSGSSIRITGKKGIRMITSIPTAARNTLINSELAGWRLMQTGTCVEWADENGVVFNSLTMKTNPALTGYAYKRGVQDPVFNRTNGLDQFTNVLVGFNIDQCKKDLVMRPYMILENTETGETAVLYGGAVQRSIGYIAYQNRLVYKPGKAAYDFIWNIIHSVYGDKYDADYKG